MKEINGCAHLYFEDGKPTKLITHLSELPKNGVIHLKSDKIYSDEEFKKSHPQDIAEFDIENNGIVISDY